MQVCDLVKYYPTAISNLSGVTLYGKKIHVTLSKHAQVQMPQAGSNVSMYVCMYVCMYYEETRSHRRNNQLHFIQT